MRISKKLFPLLSIPLLVLSVYLITRLVPPFLEELSPAETEGEKTVAPDFRLQDLGGKEIALADFKSRKVILNFWTSWNRISLDQVDVLQGYYKSVSGENIAILAINSQEDAPTIKAALKGKEFDLPVLMDEGGEVGELYDIGTLPLTIFINEAGFIVNKSLGPMNFEKINSLVNKL